MHTNAAVPPCPIHTSSRSRRAPIASATSSTGSRPSRRETASRHRPCHPSAFRGGDVFLDFPTGRRTLLWRSTARSSVTEQWTCTSNTSAAQPRRVIKQEFLRKRGFAGVSMDRFIGMLDGYMVWYRDKRIKTEFGHGHHGPSTQARSCGMIGSDGINDESNKTAPAPFDFSSI